MGNGPLGRLLKPAFAFVSRGRLPQLDGRLELPALQAPVEVFRDEWGIPHIFAQNRHDLYLAQGFVHAGDRLWQMEVNRRAAAGQLAAMLGSLALDTDRLTRTLGFHQIADQSWPSLPADMQAAVAAYTTGVNAYIAREQWPLEFTLLGHRPDPWRPRDSLAFARLQMWALSYGYAGELARAQLYQRVGRTAVAELEPHYPDDNPVILPTNFSQDNLLDAAKSPWIGRDMDGGGRGSNSWVVGPERSASGSPLLANDMHLPVTTPSIWYQVHLQSADGVHVAGLSQPGMPYVLVGHNDHIAWGATLAFADVEDIYLEKLALDNDGNETGRYLVGDEWPALSVREEVINVRGRDAHVEKVMVSRHGPLVGRLLRPDSALSLTQPPAGEPVKIALALQSSALKPEHSISGFARLNEARDWATFVAAVAEIECPPLNLTYADAAGNIGYYMSGKVPVRGRGTGRLPAPGWDPNYDWTGYIPFTEMPHTLNPPTGYIVSCNHKPVDDDYPHFLGSLWVNGYRAARLVTQIEAKAPLSVADCAAMQFDFHCAPGLALAQAIASFELSALEASRCQEYLRSWDGWLDEGSIAGSIYQVFLQESARIILEPHLGKPLLTELLGAGLHETLAPITEFYGYWPDTLLQLIRNDESHWLPGRLATEATIERALVATWQTLRRSLGSDPTQWRWGRLHQVTFNHHLARKAPLDQIFSLGPFPVGGDTDTVTQTAIRPDDPYANNAFSVSNRHIYDLAAWDRSLGVIAPGQSGHLGSDHFTDLLPLWLTGGHHPLLWQAEAIRKAAQHQLSLTPPAK